MKLIEKTLNTTTIFDGRIIRLTHDEVLLPNGKVSWREVVHHRGGVCVLAVNEESILLVKQFRSPYQAVLYECPAGKLEDSEHPQLAGKRELEEETGAYAACLLPLGIMYPSPGYTNEVIHLFYTENFVMGQMTLDDDEFLDVEKVLLKDALTWIRNGKIVDAKTIIAIYRYLDLKNKILL